MQCVGRESRELWGVRGWEGLSPVWVRAGRSRSQSGLTIGSETLEWGEYQRIGTGRVSLCTRVCEHPIG